MTRLIDNIRHKMGHTRYPIQQPMSTLNDITATSNAALQAFPYMIEVTFTATFEHHTRCKKVDIPGVEKAFIERLRWEIFGEFHKKTIELEQAAYEYDFDRVRTITMELQRMIRE